MARNDGMHGARPLSVLMSVILGLVLLVAGLVSLLLFHTIYNTAMVVGLVPITGIPLPFLSYGGSFMLLSFLATGLILNVDYRRYVNR